MMSRMRIASYLAGAVLLFAATLKAAEFLAGRTPFASQLLTVALIDAELLLGLWLLSGIHLQRASSVASLCFCAFASWSFAQAVMGKATCGCFGPIQINPWITALGDAGIASWLYLSTRGINDHRFRRRQMIVASIPSAVGVSVLSMWLLGARPARQINFAVKKDTVNVLMPSDWVGVRFPVSQYIDVWSEIQHGHWNVTFVRHDCPACLEELKKLEQQSSRLAAPGSARLAIIEMPPFSPPGQPLLPADSSILLGRLRRDIPWGMTTPTTVELTDGQVVRSSR